MRVLVTGGAGFIGSHLVTALANDGHHVRVLDDLSSGRRENLAGLPVELVVGDVGEMDVVATAVAHCDLIFHQAALVSVPRSIQEPDRNHHSNVNGSFNVFEAARHAGIKRIIYASTAAVYGQLPGLPKREDSPLQMLTPYAASKRMGELLAASYNYAYGMEIISLRYMNVFGPRQNPASPYSGVLSIFCQAAVNGKGVTIFGDGEQTRDFVYVSDVVQANLRAAAVPAAQLRDSLIFNVGRGQQTSLNEIVTQLSQLTGQAIPITHQPARPGDIKHSVADVGLAQEKLGFVAETAVPTGLKNTLAWLRSSNSTHL